MVGITRSKVIFFLNLQTNRTCFFQLIPGCYSRALSKAWGDCGKPNGARDFGCLGIWKTCLCDQNPGYLYIPGSSKCVKFVPFPPKILPRVLVIAQMTNMSQRSWRIQTGYVLAWGCLGFDHVISGYARTSCIYIYLIVHVKENHPKLIKIH